MNPSSERIENMALFLKMEGGSNEENYQTAIASKDLEQFLRKRIIKDNN